MITGRLIREGHWLYAGVAPVTIRIEEVTSMPGSGDYEDPPDVRDDRDGTFFRVSWTGAASSDFYNVGGYSALLKDAINEAEKAFPGIKWTR